MSTPYIDPGSTAFLWQILVAGFFALSFYVQSSVKSIRNAFRRRKN